jgi:uncharacterized protein DUF6262
MTHADNSHHLRTAAQARHEQSLQRTRDTIRALNRAGQPITFTGVALAAHVSRGWLYHQPELRATILNHRRPDRTPIPAVQRATPQSIAARLDALHIEIEHLRAENTMLREHVARALGQRRAEPQPLHQRHVPNTKGQQPLHLTTTRSR